MSGAVPDNLSEKLEGYVRELFGREDSILRSVRKRHDEHDLPKINISPEEGQIIHFLVRCVGARKALEVGTLGGYSGIWIARALPEDGELVTLEIDQERASLAEDAFRDAGLGPPVTVVVGDAREVMEQLEPGFDVVFLDADKASLPRYFEEAVRLLDKGGLLLCDNAFLDGKVVDESLHDEDVEGVRELNRLMADDERLVSAMIPVRDGLAVGLKVGE